MIAQLFGGAFALLFFGVSTWTAIRLLRMAYLSQRSPELLMALGLLGTGTVGFGFSILAEALEASDPHSASVTRLVGTFAISIACFSFAIFTQRVFRGRKLWAQFFVALVGAGLVGLLVVSIRHYLVVGPDRFDPAMLQRSVILASVWGWMGFECVRYRSVMRRRLAIGLADPVVVNRFTLWAFVSVESLVLNGVSTYLSVQAGGNAMNSDAAVIVTGLLGMLGATAIYLAFMPPRPYIRWVTESSGAGSASDVRR